MPKNKTYAMSRNAHRALFALSFIFVAAVILLDRTVSLRDKPLQQSASQKKIISRDLQKYNEKSFTVVKVVDGDTLDIDIHDDKYPHTRIRLWGIDTPETKGPYSLGMYFGPEAADFTRKLLLNTKVRIYLDETRTRDKYNRLLAYVQLRDRKYLNEVLVAEGYAYADVRFRHGFYQKYIRLEAAARNNQKGLWKDVTREQLPDWLKKKKPDLLLDK